MPYRPRGSGIYRKCGECGVRKFFKNWQIERADKNYCSLKCTQAANKSKWQARHPHKREAHRGEPAGRQYADNVLMFADTLETLREIDQGFEYAPDVVG